MKNFKYKVLISILVFVLVAVGTIILTRVADEEKPGKSVMSAATLPVVYMVSEGGQEYNLLHGYVTNVDESMLHECLTPLPEGRRLTIRIGTYGQTVTGISYEIRSLDGSEYIENTTVTDFKTITSQESIESDNTDGSTPLTGYMGECVEAVLNIKNLLKEDTRYMLKITVQTKNQTASYYTRIVLGDGLMLDEKLDYVLHFSEVTYDDEAINEIIPKLETNSSGDNTNLGHVNIHSKLSQVGWGKLEPSIYGKVWPTVVEIEGNVADIRLDYQVTTPAARGMDIYDVKEFFRIRRADANTTYVLGYDRYVDQIFDGLEDLNDSGRIYLGITSGLEEEQLTSDSTGKVTCFVRRGELWSYNSTKNQFVQIFTFVDDDSEYDSVRESYNRHGIKVLNVDSTGKVEFVVYGYMNRGSHEGEMGVSVCRYNPDENTVDELLYIPRNDIYEVIKKDVETLVYLNADGRFFMYQGGSIYSIHYETKEYMVVSERVIEEACLFSEDYGMFAYQEGDNANKCNEINIIYLDTGETGRIEAGNAQYIKTLGLIDGNLIYGKAFIDDICTDENGEMIYPMYRLEIVDDELSVVKEYQKTGIRIIDVETDDNKIIIRRLKVNEDGGLQETNDDQLLSKTLSLDEVLTTKQVATDVRQKELYIILTVSVSSAANTKVVYPKAIHFDSGAKMYMSEVIASSGCYRVYGMGDLKLMTRSLGEAIVSADSWAGVVVAPTGEIIWDRYKNSAASVELSENYILGNNFEIIGATLEEALYYIDMGMILRAGTDTGYVTVYAYDKSNVSFMISDGTRQSCTKAELAAAIENAGSVIYAYEVK